MEPAWNSANLSVVRVPSTRSSLNAYRQEKVVAFAFPYDQAHEFLTITREISAQTPFGHNFESHSTAQSSVWRTAEANPNRDLGACIRVAFDELLDLISHAQTLDVLVMLAEYVGVCWTLYSLFASMKSLGSSAWLATSVLLSSLFALVLGLSAARSLGIRPSRRLLSEGLPFGVVAVGFEQYTTLTRAVLSSSTRRRDSSTSNRVDAAGRLPERRFRQTFDSVQQAVLLESASIFKSYAWKVAVLTAGAASHIKGGLSHFCCLAVCVVWFDCIMLFTFYTAVLWVKVNVLWARQCNEMLLRDPAAHKICEPVATGTIEADAWAEADEQRTSKLTLFGRRIRSTDVPRFKIFMVTGFLLINLANFWPFAFRSGPSNVTIWTPSVGGLFGPPSIDPFRFAANGLENVRMTAMAHQRDTVVTVLPPVRYELGPQYIQSKSMSSSFVDIPSGAGETEVPKEVVHAASSILTSLEDPILSKIMVVALTLSVLFNGYLFDAASKRVQGQDRVPPSADGERPKRAEILVSRDVLETQGLARAAPEGQFADSSNMGVKGDPERLCHQLAEPVPSEQTLPKRSSLANGDLLQQKLAHQLTDAEVVELCTRGTIPLHGLETLLKDCARAVSLRRLVVCSKDASTVPVSPSSLSQLPYTSYDWSKVFGACCENVVGYMQIPVGLAGPLKVNGEVFHVPMATTEGMLVASTSRGCKAINAGGGATTVVAGDGMTRGPCIGFSTLVRAGAGKEWLDSQKGFTIMQQAFDGTSRFARLQSLKTAMAGTQLYIRFKATTGDAMGMNMISNGVEQALRAMQDAGFNDMTVVSVSGNFCTDKKAAAVNWIDGRGKSVVADAVIPAEAVESILKTDVESLVKLNTSKNLIGSAMAGALGGFNAHAANIVAALFIATGQDPAQVVESSNCITIMRNLHGSLHISVSMPSIEVGTLGGGTILEPQAAMLEILGVRGPHPTDAGKNARRLAQITAALVLAGELSTCSALAAGHLVRAHLQGNRSAAPCDPSAAASHKS